MKKLFTLALVLSLVGCANSSNYENLGLKDQPLSKFAYIQMNDQYAMTAKHIETTPNVAYECSSGCDLVFFYNPDVNFKQPIWRNPIIGEKVVQVGIDYQGKTVERTGRVLETYSKPSEQSKFYYMSTSSFTVKGMSGGPVYGQDNRMIGMTLGSPKLKDEDGVNSVFVSNEIIQYEWKKFQESK